MRDAATNRFSLISPLTSPSPGTPGSNQSRRSISGYGKIDSVLKEWNAESVESVLGLARIVAEMSETIISENESVVRAFSSQPLALACVPPSGRPSLTRSGSFQRPSFASVETVDVSSYRHNSSKYARARVYLKLIMYILRDVAPVTLNAAQFTASNVFAKSDTRAAGLLAGSGPVLQKRASSVVATGVVPEFSPEAARNLLESDLASVSPLRGFSW